LPYNPPVPDYSGGTATDLHRIPGCLLIDLFIAVLCQMQAQNQFSVFKLPQPDLS
jgi:hypothetical protein